MSLFIVFLLGIANFALHRAVLESGHPLLRQLPSFLRGGARLSLGIEFLLLAGSMLMVDGGSAAWAWGYGAYSMVNALSAWLILSGRA